MMLNISLGIAVDVIYIAFKLPCKTYGYDSEDLGYSDHELLRGILVGKIRIILILCFNPDSALLLKYRELAEHS